MKLLIQADDYGITRAVSSGIILEFIMVLSVILAYLQIWTGQKNV